MVLFVRTFTRVLISAGLGLGLLLGGSPGLAAIADETDPFANIAAVMRSGDLARADRMLRRLLDDDRHRQRAVQTLERLHQLETFNLEPDELTIGRALKSTGTVMRRYETQHFVTLSDCDAAWTRKKTALLERTYHQFYRFTEQFGIEVVPPERKLLCIIFADYERYRRFAKSVDGVDAPWAGGYFATRSNRVVLFDDRDSPAINQAIDTLEEHQSQARETRERAIKAASTDWDSMAEALSLAADRLDAQVDTNRARILAHAERLATSKTIHEAVHLLSYNSRLQSLGRVYPFWVSEGLATAFETDKPGLPFGPTRSYAPRETGFDRVVAESRLIPIDTVVTVPAGLEGADQLGDPIYSQSYQLFTHLAQSSPGAMRDYLAELQRMPSSYFNRDLHKAVFEKHFGRLGAIERALTRGRGEAKLAQSKR
jgi:Protein of unknown function (DUF1570)